MRHAAASTPAAALAWGILLATAFAVSPASGKDFPFVPRSGDRSEGFVRQQDVSGDLFRLVAVQLAGPALREPPTRLRLWIPRATLLEELRVHEPRSNYLMVPRLERLGASGSFSWSTEDVIRPAHVRVEFLRVLASDASGRYYPVLLSGEDSPAAAPYAYRFVFHSGAGRRLDWSVCREDGGMLTPLFESVTESPHGGPLTVEWNGRGADGSLAVAGNHRLLVRARTKNPSGSDVSLEIPFVVYARPD